MLSPLEAVRCLTTAYRDQNPRTFGPALINAHGRRANAFLRNEPTARAPGSADLGSIARSGYHCVFVPDGSPKGGTRPMDHAVKRREFLRQVGAGVTGGMLAGAALAADAGPPQSQPSAPPTPVGTIRDLPTRRLGRIGIQLPPLSFGTASMGHAFYQAEPFEQVLEAAIAAGVRLLDTARIYDVPQERLSPCFAGTARKSSGSQIPGQIP